MEAAEVESLESAVITVEQMIDICLSPFHIDVNLLHALLNIIASKLNLQTVRVHLGAPGLLTEINNLIAKSRESYEAYKVVDGGAKRPFKLTLCKLEKIDIEPDPPVETVYKVWKPTTDLKDFHRVTFFKDGPMIQDIAPGTDITDQVGYTYAELLNLAKRLEACEIGIEKLSQLLQKMNSNYKDLERSLVEINTLEHMTKIADNGNKRVSKAIERCSQVEVIQPGKNGDRELRFERDQEARRDIQNMQETMGGIIDQINSLFGRMSDFRNMLQELQRENDMLKKLLQRSADREKLEQCLREICSMQKAMAEFSDKMSDLILCNNKSNQRFKEFNEQLTKVSKFRTTFEKIARLEDFTKGLQAEFEIFTERYEQIKVFKADREELDYIFQSKADKKELDNLVTQEVFNAIRTDLSSGIVQAYEHIMDVELKWKSSEENICARLENKLDKSEKSSLTKLVYDKLGCLQEKVNELIEARFNVQSAGVRTKALKDANCICCASQADIVCDKPTLPKLSAIRHIRKICPEPPELRKRYCGGSHTILSPEQKLAQRKSMPMYMDPSRDAPNLIEGKNGMMYRISKPECNCGEKKFPKVLYPSKNLESANKNPNEEQVNLDASDVKS